MERRNSRRFLWPTLSCAKNKKGFSEDLYHILGQRAKQDRRSLTSEAIYLLEWALEATTKEKSSILQFRGLGKKQWKKEDAAKHVDQERDSWE